MTVWIICGVIGASLAWLGIAVAATAASVRAFHDAWRTLAVRLGAAEDLLPAALALKERAERLQPRLAAAQTHASALQSPGSAHRRAS